MRLYALISTLLIALIATPASSSQQEPPPTQINKVCVPAHRIPPAGSNQCPTACATPFPSPQCAGTSLLGFAVKGKCVTGEGTCRETGGGQVSIQLYNYDCALDSSGGCTPPEVLCKYVESGPSSTYHTVTDCSA